MECGLSRETARRSELAGWAEYGYCASHSRFFWLRLHLLCEGRVVVTSADPNADLAIEPGFLTTDRDRGITATTLRRMRELFAQEPIARHIVEETLPGTSVDSDDDIADAALTNGHCGYHAVGTCAMGPAQDDVVDPQLRVRGVDNLRVVDCSVMPTMISGNLNGPVTAMAWRAADFIIEGLGT